MGYELDNLGQWWQTGVDDQGRFQATEVSGPPTPPLPPSTQPDSAIQVQQSVQAATTQKNFRQMVGEVSMWNPDAPTTLVESWVATRYRQILDERLWFGTKVRGILSVPPMLTGPGTVSVVPGSNIVTGVGTAFDPSASYIGRQFRIGYGMPSFTIIDVPDPTHLTLDLAWGNNVMSGVSFQIFSQYVSFGSNVKRIKSALNQMMGWRMVVDMPKEAVDASDAWRTNPGWSRAIINGFSSPTGTPLWELYPTPTARQTFPFSAYVQPPDLSDDNPFPMSNIPSDLIVVGCIPDALLHGGRQSPRYDPQTAQWKLREFLGRLERLKLADDSLNMIDLSWDFSRYSVAQGGSSWAQEHDCEA